MDNDILEVNELGDDDLLALYDTILNHLNYLQSNIIELSEEVDSENE